MAWWQHLRDAKQRARRGSVRKRAVLLETTHRLLIEVAANAAITCLRTGADTRRREDRLLDVRLDHLVAKQCDVGLARLARQRVVEHDALDGVEERVPRRQHDRSTHANARLGNRQMRNTTIVDRVDQRLGRRRHDADELVHRPDVELVPVAGLAIDTNHVRVGIAKEVRRAARLAQVVVKERVRATDQIRAPDCIHRGSHQHAEAITVLITTGPEGCERSGRAITNDGEILRVECVGRMHGEILIVCGGPGECPTSSYGQRRACDQTP